MFKLLSLGIGLYLLYRLFLNDNKLPTGDQNASLEEDGDYIDYEEVD